MSEMVLALSPVLRTLRSHPAPLLRNRASVAEVAFSLLLAICSLNSWKGVLWSEWECGLARRISIITGVLIVFV